MIKKHNNIKYTKITFMNINYTILTLLCTTIGQNENNF